MRLQFILNVETVAVTTTPPVSIFPPNEPVPVGVGRTFNGKYITPPGSAVEATLEYVHTTTSVGTLGGYVGDVGIGNMCLHARTPCGQRLVIYYAYEILIGDPVVPFTVQTVEGQVTAATIDGNNVYVKPKLEIIEGGRSYAVQLTVKPLCK